MHNILPAKALRNWKIFVNSYIITIIFVIKISKNTCNLTINDYDKTILSERRALLPAGQILPAEAFNLPMKPDILFILLVSLIKHSLNV